MVRGVDPEGIKYDLTPLVCKMCEHKWYARKVGKIRTCPVCRSTNWNLGKRIIVQNIPVITCPKCEHKWEPRNYDLKECPKCKKRLFSIRKE